MAYGLTPNSDGTPKQSIFPTGNVNTVQYQNSSNGLSGASNVEISSEGNICLLDATVPTTPTSGKCVLFAEQVGGRQMPAYIGPSGLDSVLQPFLARNKICYWSGIGNATTAPLALGMAAPTAVGTATAVNVSAGGYVAQTKRLRYAVTTASATAIAGWRLAVAQFSLGNSGVGGFTYVQRWSPGGNGVPATKRMFHGLRNVVTGPTDVEPTTYVNCIGVGCNAADTTLSIIYNDASGTASTIPLGSNFPKNNSNTDLYELCLFSRPNTTTVEYQMRRLNTGHEATGTLSTDLPSNTTLLAPLGWESVGGTSSTIGVDLVSLYIETDY